MTIISIQLSKLVHSPANVRKTGGVSVDDLAASIAAHGLIQCLNVRAAGSGKYEVVAGGRRLAALKRLAKEKRLSKNVAVSCRLLEDEDATEISLAENQIRQAMHPADQFDAFKALSDRGMSSDDIAARFGVTGRMVEQRLKLASVSPALFALYRADEMTLEQLMAFTLTADHERQEAVWQLVSASYGSGAYAIRRHLIETKVSGNDKRALLIGQEAFIAAGGSVARDLFAAEDECFFEDAALLDRLVAERLDEAAAGVLAEGWGWVDASPDLPHGRYRLFPATRRDFTDDEQAEFDRLVAEADEIALNDTGDEGAEARHEALEARIATLEEGRLSFPDEAKAQSGAVVHLERDGSLGIERGYVRHDAALPVASASAGPVKEKPELSAALLQELTVHRTQAMQAALARDPSAGLDALVHCLALSSFYYRRHLSCLEISATTSYPGKSSPALTETPAAAILADIRERWEQALPEEAEDLWQWLRGSAQSVKIELLSYLAAQSIDAVQAGGAVAKASADDLHSALGLDMADYWTATAEGYFSRVPKKQVIEAMVEAGALPTNPDGMKKAALAGLAEKRMAGTRWLPKPLRSPETATDAGEAPEIALAA